MMWTVNSRIVLAFIGSMVCCFLLVGCGRSSVSQKAVVSSLTKLPMYKSAPTFQGRNYTGETFTTDSLRGEVWIAYFFFTSCGGPCPTMNTVVGDLDRKLSGKVRFVGISVDPETDTPEVMATYIRRFTEQPKRWFMLTMPKDSVVKVAATGFMLGSKEEPELHSTRLVLVDEVGDIRGYYDGLDSVAIESL